MSDRSAIEWTDATLNPVRGCVKVSPGCKHCYAETFAERFRGVPGHPYEQGFDPRLVPAKWLEPFGWPTSRSVFVNSMSDLFGDFVPEAYLRVAGHVFDRADWHIYQVLTKRSGKLREALETTLAPVAARRHVWWGVSVEDRKYGLPRVEDLCASTAGVRFLSVEPLLEDLGELPLAGIDWVIVGGESGPRARPVDPDWVRSIRDQCLAAGVPFFFKQWGGARKSRAGRTLDGVTHDERPPLVEVSVPPRRERIARRAEAAHFLGREGWPVEA